MSNCLRLHIHAFVKAIRPLNAMGRRSDGYVAVVMAKTAKIEEPLNINKCFGKHSLSEHVH